MILVAVFGVAPAMALVVESPKEGQVLVVGETIEWKIRPEPGEVCKSVNHGAPFNSKTGMYEWTYTIQPDDALGQELGKQSIIIDGESVGKARCRSTRAPIIVVLPPTTTITKIQANFGGKKKGLPRYCSKAQW